MNNKIITSLESGALDQIGSRREALSRVGKFGAGLAFAAVPSVLSAVFARKAHADHELSVVDRLNFALTLEYLEAAFYVRGVESGVVPSGEPRAIFTTIRDHEVTHVQALQETINALGGTPVEEPEFDFTAGGAFDPFQNYGTFVVLATAFEDTGVRAYKGQAPFLIDNPEILTAALRIHAVEARHASEVRRLMQSYAGEGWIPFDQPDAPAAVAPVYGPGMNQMGEQVFPSEANTTHLGLDVLNVTGVSAEAVTEAWDEPLNRYAVLQIVDAFIVGDVDGDGTET